MRRLRAGWPQTWSWPGCGWPSSPATTCSRRPPASSRWIARSSKWPGTFLEAPKNRKYRRTIYPRHAPGGYPLADKLAARIEAARAEQETGTNPLGLLFPSARGKYWRSSNFNRNVLKRAYLAAGWRGAGGAEMWTWHSLRHVFCTTALFTWKLDATDVSRLAGHANYRITLDMYVGTTAGVLDRARKATEGTVQPV